MRNSAVFFIAAVVGTIAPLAACAQGKLALAADDPGGSAAVGEVRVDPGPGNRPVEEDSRFADRALVQAVGTNDPQAARLLDSEFTWIDRDGRSRSKSDLVDRIGLLSAGPDANLALRAYGHVALVTGTHSLTPDGAEAFFARVWVRRASGWRLLLYQETAPGDFSAKDARYGVARAQRPDGCDNPCSSLPYKPLSPDAEEIVASFMAGERALFEGDAEAAGRMFGDDALFITPDGAQPIDKTQRMAAIRGLMQAGQADPPPAVASIAVWVFGEAAIMSADQESRVGEVLRDTRIWSKRDGRWQLIFSQQTEVQ